LKITIFGLTLSSSWGNGHATPYRAILRALSGQGHRITFYEKDVEYYRRHRDLNHCDYCELVLHAGWSEVRSRALAEAAASDAIIVGSYCPDGARISDELLELARPLHVFYDLDTPVTLAALAQGDLEYLRRDQVPAFELYLSFTGGRILRDLEGPWKARRARALYGCVDPEAHARVAGREEFRCELSYMGTYAEDRQAKLEELFLAPARHMAGGHFVLAGPLYPRHWEWPQNVRRFEHLSPQQHPALYSSSRATLNITREGMARYGHCPSGRFFEAAACATPIITDWFEGLDSFFSVQDELLLARNAEDVVGALRLPDSALQRIASRARARTLEQHTAEARARQLIEYLNQARHWKQDSHTTPLVTPARNSREAPS
jgi:spore maturation protein CgeB